MKQNQYLKDMMFKKFRLFTRDSISTILKEENIPNDREFCFSAFICHIFGFHTVYTL